MKPLRSLNHKAPRPQPSSLMINRLVIRNMKAWIRRTTRSHSHRHRKKAPEVISPRNRLFYPHTQAKGRQRKWGTIIQKHESTSETSLPTRLKSRRRRWRVNWKRLPANWSQSPRTQRESWGTRPSWYTFSRHPQGAQTEWTPHSLDGNLSNCHVIK